MEWSIWVTRMLHVFLIFNIILETETHKRGVNRAFDPRVRRPLDRNQKSRAQQPPNVDTENSKRSRRYNNKTATIHRRTSQIYKLLDQNFSDSDNKRFAAFNFSKQYPKQPSTDSRGKVTFVRGREYFVLGNGNDKMQLAVKYGPKPHIGTPWPMPKYFNISDIAYLVGTSLRFKFDTSLVNADVLEWYSARISDVIRKVWNEDYGVRLEETIDEETIIGAVTIEIRNDSKKYPDIESNESYIMSVNATGCWIQAQEVWGALRGLETFSQLIHTDPQGRVVIRAVHVEDEPRFRHRGLMIDTSRHYISMDTIIQNLEAMAMNKLNVFHWHIVDDQSFPYQSKAFPDLSEKGAFHPDAVYTHNDIRRIIKEARLRGIRVIPEFDSPGHTLSWGYGQHDLLTPCFLPKPLIPNGLFGPINPLQESSYKFLKTLFTEVASVFVDRYIHVGGDEVSPGCWASNPLIRVRMNALNLTKPSDMKYLAQHYHRRLMKLMKDIGLRRKQGLESIVWQEVVDEGAQVGNDTLIQLWKVNPGRIQYYLDAGYKVLYSGCWYVDNWKMGSQWAKFYQCQRDSTTFHGSYRYEKNFYGGEVCMWNEYADDPEMTARIWPRAAAAAERLWSPASVIDIQKAAPRIEQQRCRMMRKGIPVGVASGPGYCGEHKRAAPQKADPVQRLEGHNRQLQQREPNIIKTESKERGIFQDKVQTEKQWILIVSIIGILLFISGYRIYKSTSCHLKKENPHSSKWKLRMTLLLYCIVAYMILWVVTILYFSK